MIPAAAIHDDISGDAGENQNDATAGGETEIEFGWKLTGAASSWTWRRCVTRAKDIRIPRNCQGCCQSRRQHDSMNRQRKQRNGPGRLAQDEK